ncbi:SAMD15 [Bugula neritina]|uniref:SAMD15 n=1 Tax=Bugula neritina TaxID=10212 RepID=A0A7J7IVL6_BUGNE|nr:SAMD15 [Bugula neritina]
MSGTGSAIIEDLKDSRVPPCLYWSVEQVSEWVASELGLEEYKECFEKNKVDGRMLVFVTSSTLPQIGVTDFEHIKIISRGVRDILQLEDPFWNRSISLPPRDQKGMYIESKAVRGQHADGLTYQLYLDTHEEPLWQPPLNNHCQLLPH